MLRRLLFSLPLLVCALVPSAAQAGQNGLVLGLEGGYASWGLDGTKISPTDPSVADWDASMGPAFVSPINAKSNYALNLHLGWNVLGHASVEAAIHATSWDLFHKWRGGGGFVGGRATWWPMQLFLAKDRKYDAGIELGTGYSMAGGPDFGMNGAYFQTGLAAEYMVLPFLGFSANFRYFKPFWNKFYTNFDENIGTTATGPSGGWTTFTIGINLHVPVPVGEEKEKKKDEKK